MKAMILIALLAGASPALAETIYVSNERGHSISVIDGATLKTVAEWPVGNRPRGIILSRDGTRLYVCASDEHSVQVIDRKDGRILADLPAGDDPGHVEFTADGRELWASSEIGGTVQIVDTKSHAVTAKIGFAVPRVSPDKILPVAIRFTPDGARALVALGRANHVAVIDVKTRQVLAYIPVGMRVWHLAISA